MTTPPVIDPQVLISWDGSGDFDGIYDDVTDDVAGQPGVSIDMGRDGSRALGPPRVHSAEFEVYNDDGAYSQERGDSPVYQLIVPGRPVSVHVHYGTTDTYDAATPYDEPDPYDGVATYGLARTSIDEIAQQTAIGSRRVRFSTLGVEALLVANTVTVPVMVNPRVDQCVTAILDAVGWPSDKRDISISDTTLLYWWCDDRSAWAALQELLHSEGPGSLWTDGDGVLHFENRNYRTTTPRCTTSQAAFFDVDAGAPSAYDEPDPYDADDFYDGRASGLYFTDLQYEPGFRSLYNRATYTTKRRTLGSLQAVWSYGTDLSLGSGQTRTLIARPQDPFQDATTPVGGSDYTVSGGTVSINLLATSGLVAFLTITATSGTPTVSGLQLRARPLTVTSETTIQNSVDASASIAKFGERTLSVQGWPEIDPVQAEAVCDSWVTRYEIQRPSVTLTLRAADEAHVLQMLRRTISDRITVFERNTGLSADLWVNSKHYEIRLRELVVVLGCEKVAEVGGSLWDAGLWDLAVWGT